MPGWQIALIAVGSALAAATVAVAADRARGAHRKLAGVACLAWRSGPPYGGRRTGPPVEPAQGGERPDPVEAGGEDLRAGQVLSPGWPRQGVTGPLRGMGAAGHDRS